MDTMAREASICCNYSALSIDCSPMPVGKSIDPCDSDSVWGRAGRNHYFSSDAAWLERTNIHFDE